MFAKHIRRSAKHIITSEQLTFVVRRRASLDGRNQQTGRVKGSTLLPVSSFIGLSSYSQVVDQSAAVAKAQPGFGPLHPDSLPVALGHHQPHHPAGLSHAFSDNRSLSPSINTLPVKTRPQPLRSFCLFFLEQLGRTWCHILRPTTLNMATSTGNPCLTSATTLASCLQCQKTVLNLWGSKVNHPSLPSYCALVSNLMWHHLHSVWFF